MNNLNRSTKPLGDPLTNLLDRLDRDAAHYAGRERRGDDRVAYRKRGVRFVVIHPQGGRHEMRSFARNLAPGGIALLHEGFLHPGSVCMIWLDQPGGEPLEVTAHIASCRFHTGKMHESSIAFEERLDPASVLGESAMRRAKDHQTQVRRRLDGLRILYVGAMDWQREMVLDTIQQVGGEITVAEFLGACLDTIGRKRQDLVLCEPSLPEAGGAELVSRIRSAGYRGPIMALGWDEDDLHACREMEDAGVISALSFDQAEDLLNALPVPVEAGA